MNEQVRILLPNDLWNHFTDLNAIPRPSKKETAVIAFIQKFGQSLQLDTYVDEAGNVIIKKPASPGMENRMTVVLQSHLDMVHQKNSDRVFDFEKQGIEMLVDNDWVKANGTTLGADNGIGVAAIMAILSSSAIQHPPIEALFTIDEETGMTGALALKGGLLSGKILLNLDTEEDNELTIGCAGGMDVTASGQYKQVSPMPGKAFRIALTGLTGGHSGMDIHKGRGNANKLMNRLLLQLANEINIQIAAIDGGSLRNAIPRESVADIVINTADEEKLKSFISNQQRVYVTENDITDPNLALNIKAIEMPVAVMDSSFQQTLLRSVYACPNGIYRMTPGMEGLVQSSNNIARVLIKDGAYSIQCLTRSAVNSEKEDLARAIACAFELTGATISYASSYPGWQPRPDAAIVQLMSNLYKELFHDEAHVDAVHAGLECGILGSNYPGMQMISFGPNITGAHSPDEKVQISSVQKFWQFLLETLKRIPSAN